MDLRKIYHEANCLIAQTHGSTDVPENGNVTVIVDGITYIVHFRKVESGWNIIKAEKG